MIVKFSQDAKPYTVYPWRLQQSLFSSDASIKLGLKELEGGESAHRWQRYNRLGSTSSHDHGRSYVPPNSVTYEESSFY